MAGGKTGKILFTILLFSLSAMISSSFNVDESQKSIVFAQSPGSFANRAVDPVPENDYSGNGPIPEDNSTDVITGPIPEDNSIGNGGGAFTGTSGNQGLSDFNNLTNTGLPADVASIVNNATNQGTGTGFSPASQGTTQTNPPSVPEFGSIASIVLVVSIISIVMLSARTKLRFN